MKKICIIHQHKNAYSETFIRAHIQRLPANVCVIYNALSENPIFQKNDHSLIPQSYASKAYRLLNNKVFNKSIDLFYNKALVRFLKNEKIDIVLAEYGIIGVKVMQACRDANVSLVVHFHGFDASRYDVIEKYKREYKKLFEIASAIIVVSKEMMNTLIHLGAPKENLFHNVYGVDVSSFGRSNLLTSPPHFLAVGRFVEKKAPYLTILAFEKLVKKYPKAKLIMVGEGILLNVSKQLVQSLGLEKQVDFLGAQSHSKVAELMKQSRAFVQHSIKSGDGDSEGTPVGILEACASGLPVISTRHAGIKDVVIEGTTGFLVDEGDIVGMAKYMELILDNPKDAKSIGESGRKYIIENHTMEKSIDGLWKIISNC